MARLVTTASAAVAISVLGCRPQPLQDGSDLNDRAEQQVGPARFIVSASWLGDPAALAGYFDRRSRAVCHNIGYRRHSVSRMASSGAPAPGRTVRYAVYADCSEPGYEQERRQPMLVLQDKSGPLPEMPPTDVQYVPSVERGVAPLPVTTGCEDGHWISSVSGGGAIISLEDGSVWGVAQMDRLKSRLWLPMSRVANCGHMLVNLDDDEVVSARALAGRTTYAPTESGRWYVVQAVTDAGSIVIGDRTFQQRRLCHGLRDGDRVLFVSGGPNRACATATFVVARTEGVCTVSCDY
jgi:hypothetical protein